MIQETDIAIKGRHRYLQNRYLQNRHSNPHSLKVIQEKSTKPIDLSIVLLYNNIAEIIGCRSFGRLNNERIE